MNKNQKFSPFKKKKKLWIFDEKKENSKANPKFVHHDIKIRYNKKKHEERMRLVILSWQLSVSFCEFCYHKEY